jgi:hypothetical protein
MPSNSKGDSPPPKRKFFFDENLAPRLAKAIGDLCEEAEVVHLRSRYGPRTSDVHWLRELASEGGWTLVVADARIWTRPQEQEILREGRFPAFLLAKGWTNHGFWDQAWHLVRWWPILMEVAARLKPGEHYEVPWKTIGQDKLRRL